jgi:hypothetical protein
MSNKNISSYREKLCADLINVLLFAWSAVYYTDKSIIEKNIDERTICANLKSKFDEIIKCNNSLLNGYFADVEYNRNGIDIKEGYCGNKIINDLIIHSRQTKMVDNLLHIGMQNGKGCSSSQGDIDRLKETTKIGYLPFNYISGAFVEYDSNSWEITFIYNGKEAYVSTFEKV